MGQDQDQDQIIPFESLAESSLTHCRFSGTPPSDGTMRRFVAHPARFLHKMPDTMTYAVGALIEPLSVAYNAVIRAAPYLGQPVLIAGAGPIGLAMALCARAAGASPICITDLEENRLAQARSMGFTQTLKIDLAWDRLETAKRVREVMGPGCVPSLAFECTGAESSINSACYVSRVHLSRITMMLPSAEALLTSHRPLRTAVRSCKSDAASPISPSPSCRSASAKSTSSPRSDTVSPGPWSSVSWPPVSLAMSRR